MEYVQKLELIIFALIMFNAFDWFMGLYYRKICKRSKCGKCFFWSCPFYQLLSRKSLIKYLDKQIEVTNRSLGKIKDDKMIIAYSAEISAYQHTKFYLERCK